MSKVFCIDVAKCNGCYNCQLACKDEHVDNDWAPYARPQPEIGQFWVKVKENVGGTIPKVKIHYISQLCNHCEKASCIAACKIGAIYRRDDGLVLIGSPKMRRLAARCRQGCPLRGHPTSTRKLKNAQNAPAAPIFWNTLQAPRA